VDRHGVRPRQQFLEGDLLDAVAGHLLAADERIRGDHLVDNRDEPFGDRPADRAEADDAGRQRREAVRRRGGLAVPPARGDRFPVLRQATEESQEERHGVGGDLLETVAGHVCHADPPVGRGLQIDVVDADAVPCDHPAVVHAGDRVGVEFVPEIQHAVGVPERVPCRPLVGVDTDVVRECSHVRDAVEYLPLHGEILEVVVRDDDNTPAHTTSSDPSVRYSATRSRFSSTPSPAPSGTRIEPSSRIGPSPATRSHISFHQGTSRA